MTLSTDMIVLEPVNPREVFDFALSLLARDFEGEGEPRWEYRRKGDTWIAESTGKPVTQGDSLYMTECGQGLPAWFFLFHAEDGPLVLFDAEEQEEQREWDPDWTLPPFNEHFLRLDFDTAYGYERAGAGCGDLHAWLVLEVGRWLAARGVTEVLWKLEYDGTWHGLDEIHLLGNPDKGAIPEKGTDPK